MAGSTPRPRGCSWEDKEAAAVRELVASLPAWEKSLEPGAALVHMGAYAMHTLTNFF